MEYREELVDLPDGRVLEVAAAGDPAGLTVFLHHGSPGSVRTLTSFEPLLEHGNFFMVTLSRPGYGRSSRREGRAIASVVDDTGFALDAFERSGYAALGWSGGGPHSLACAALDTPRCRGAVSLAGVVPVDVDVDWTEGMAPENVEEFARAKEGGPAYEAAMEAAGASMAAMNADSAFDTFGELLSEPDREVLGDPFTMSSFVDATTHAFVESWRGFFDDDVAFLKPWGFDPTAIDVPVEIFYGDHDHMVPPTHGAWLASHITTARVYHNESEGHLSVWTRHFDEVAKALNGISA